MPRPSLRWQLPLVVFALCATMGPRPLHAQHTMTNRIRPLHERLAAADAAAVVTVTEVGVGRIRLDNVRALFGAPPAEFEIKRKPSAPPPLSEGDRALLLLRGARSPYLTVDEPKDTIRLSSPEMETRWVAAVQDLRGRVDTPGALVPLYLSWIRNGPETLGELAVVALKDPKAPFRPLDPEVHLELARVAASADQPAAVRRAAAGLAVVSAKATALLAAQVPVEAAPNAEVTRAVLHGTLVHRTEGGEAAFLRALQHERAEIRRAALSVLLNIARFLSPPLAHAVRELAAQDSDPHVSARAARVIEAMGKRRRSPDAFPEQVELFQSES